MGKNSAKRKLLRHKYKHRVAALMGAAIMTGAVLSGIPATKALAAEKPANPNPLKTEQALQVKDTSRPTGSGWHRHDHSWPSPDENQAWYQDGKIYYRSDNHRSRWYDEYAYTDSSPVDYVKARAGNYGFDAVRDSFSLLTITHRRALVEVRDYDTGKLYNVLLERNYGQDWTIVSVRNI
jgi:hypothetical protein